MIYHLLIKLMLYSLFLWLAPLEGLLATIDLPVTAIYSIFAQLSDLNNSPFYSTLQQEKAMFSQQELSQS